MKTSLANRLTQLASRLEELNVLLAAPDVTRDLDRYRALSREHAEIAPRVALYREWQQAERDLASARDLLSDPEMKAYAEDEAKAATARMQRLEEELQQALLPKDPSDERNVFLEIRGGTGGDDAALLDRGRLRSDDAVAERNG